MDKNKLNKLANDAYLAVCEMEFAHRTTPESGRLQGAHGESFKAMRTALLAFSEAAAATHPAESAFAARALKSFVENDALHPLLAQKLERFSR